MQFGTGVFRTVAALALLLAIPGPLISQGLDEDRAAVTRMLNDASRALSARNPARFLSYFEKPSMPQFARLQAHVAALTAQADIASSIRVADFVPHGAGFRGTLDWILQLTLVGAPGQVENRRADIRFVVVRSGKAKKRWKITALEPVDFFRPL